MRRGHVGWDYNERAISTRYVALATLLRAARPVNTRSHEWLRLESNTSITIGRQEAAE